MIPLIFIPAGIVAVLALFIPVGTKIIEWSNHIKYVTPSEYPELHEMVDRLSTKTGIPKPKVGICEMEIPNAFTFGGFQRSARVCVTTKLLEILENDEIEAVLGHEIAHIKHRDVALISALSFPPLLCYHVGMALFFFSLAMILGGSTREESGGWAFRLVMIPVALCIWLTTWAIYIVGQLVELYVSRRREYSADRASAELTGKPHNLANALFKITHVSALLETEQVRKAGAIRAFLASDPSRAKDDLKSLMEAGLDEDGTVSEKELERLAKEDRRTLFDRAAELFSTHPNTVSRVRRLITLKETDLKQELETSRKALSGWWLLPVLLQWLGGLIAWNILKKERPKSARNMLTSGIALTAIIYLVSAL
jgi:heat shock protein HtpX